MSNVFKNEYDENENFYKTEKGFDHKPPEILKESIQNKDLYTNDVNVLLESMKLGGGENNLPTYNYNFDDLTKTNLNLEENGDLKNLKTELNNNSIIGKVEKSKLCITNNNLNEEEMYKQITNKYNLIENNDYGGFHEQEIFDFHECN